MTPSEIYKHAWGLIKEEDLRDEQFKSEYSKILEKAKTFFKEYALSNEWLSFRNPFFDDELCIVHSAPSYSDVRQIGINSKVIANNLYFGVYILRENPYEMKQQDFLNVDAAFQYWIYCILKNWFSPLKKNK